MGGVVATPPDLLEWASCALGVLPASCFSDFSGRAGAAATVSGVMVQPVAAGTAAAGTASVSTRIVFTTGTASAIGIWYTRAPAGAGRSAGVAAGARRGLLDAAAPVTVTGLDAAGGVMFTAEAPPCAPGAEAPCFVGWAAPAPAASMLTAVTLAVPAAAALAPVVTGVTFYHASGDARVCGSGAPANEWMT